MDEPSSSTQPPLRKWWPGMACVRPEIIDPDYNNFAPRVGFAYQVAKNTVIRAGGGIYYATDNANELQFEIVGAPFYSSQTVTATTPTLSLSNLFPAAGVGAVFNPFTLNLHNRTPYVSQWTFDVQHTFGSNNFVELGYSGNTAQKLAQRYNLDAGTIDPTNTWPNPTFGQITSTQVDARRLQLGLRLTF